MGYLYQRKQRDGTKGGPWWMKYYVNGKCIQESTKTTSIKDAERILKDREGRAAVGLPIPRRLDRIRYDELAQDLRLHYQTTGERDLKEAEDRFKPLHAFFKGRRIVDVDGALITRYIEHRQQSVSNATCNRELNILSRMLRLGYERDKVARIPIIHMLKEAEPRKGFFERDAFEAVRKRLRPDLQVAVMIAYTFGWRIQSEVLTLTLSQVDLEAGTLRLDPGSTKNDDGRIVYLTPELQRLIAEQLERVKTLSRKLERVVPYLFPHPHRKGRYAGTRLLDFKTAWLKACKDANVVGMIRHDFRRTAVRNLVNAGVPERVAQTMTGHKTRSVFDRYHIVSPNDLKEAAKRLAAIPAKTLEDRKSAQGVEI